MHDDVIHQPQATHRIRIYLAGPDLFFPDGQERYDRLRALCAFHGLDAVTPTDGLEESAVIGAADRAITIFQHNMHLLLSCDAVLANLSPFRGTEPDSGTVFEVAYAHARGMPVAGYTLDGLTVEKRHILLRKGDRDTSGALLDRQDGGFVERFALPLNLMLACAFPVTQTPQQALAHLMV